MANNQKMRTESDLLGSVELPADVLYGVQTLRAVSYTHLTLPTSDLV